MKVLSLFDGISCGMLALNKAGIKVDKYYASEIYDKAIEISKHNFKKIIHIGDILNLDYKEFKRKGIDLLIGGSPCQDLSCLKTDGMGLSGEKSKLIFKFVELKRKIKPKYFLLENVVPKKYEWRIEIDKLMGVKGVAINSDLFVPQNRPRIYWTNIPIINLPKRLTWDFEYWQWRRTYFRKNASGVCPCLCASMGTGGHNVPLHSKDLKDRLSPEECEILQGIPEHYTNVGVANCHRYKTIGDSWTIPVLVRIFKSLRMQ